MLLLLLGIAVVGMIAFLVLRVKYPSKYDFDVHDFFTIMSWLFGFVVLGLIIAICCLSTTVATEITIDSKIEMYQEENDNIERDIDRVVKEYLEHEHDIFADLKTEESSIVLVTLFPELKADALIQQQLEIYINNNAQIRSLKKEKIDIMRKKWILYFGK